MVETNSKDFMERIEGKVDRMGEKVDQIEETVDGIRPRPSRASMEEEMEELRALVVEGRHQSHLSRVSFVKL